MIRNKVMPELVSDAKILEAGTVYIGSVLDAKQVSRLNQHTGDSLFVGRQGLHLDIHFPGKRDRIDGQFGKMLLGCLLP